MKTKFDEKEAIEVLTLMKEELAEKDTVTEKALDMAIDALNVQIKNGEDN